MRFNIIVRGPAFSATLEFTAESSFSLYACATMRDVHREKVGIAARVARAYGVSIMPPVVVEAQCLALIPHPEYYRGPADPDIARIFARMKIDRLIWRVRDWIDGAHYALHLMDASAPRIDYWYVREFLRDRCYDEMTAQRVALAAVSFDPTRLVQDTYIPL